MRYSLTLAALLSILATSLAQAVERRFTITFALDESALNAAAEATLAEISVAALAADVYRIEVAGHTDARGSEVYNGRLSAKRATTVESALLANGLRADRIMRASFGESRLLYTESAKRDTGAISRIGFPPLVDTDSSASLGMTDNARADENGHAANRRVEVTLSTERITSTEQLYSALARGFGESRTHRHGDATQIIGCHGTSVDVPARAFVRADGSELPDDANVEVLLEEATRPGAMIAYRLNTNGASGHLRTGGMVRVTAHCQGEELRLRPGGALDVTVPTAAASKAMRLYLGERDASGAMDWTLAAGETVATTTRMTAGPVPTPRSAGMQDSLDRVRALLAERDAELAKIAFPQNLTDEVLAPMFPKFKQFGRAYDPRLGEPKRPYVGTEPKRETVTRGTLLRPARTQQAEVDAQYELDSAAYAALAPERAEKLAQWNDSLTSFRAAEPARRAAFDTRELAIAEARVEQAQGYLRDNHRTRAAQRFELWREILEQAGPRAESELGSVNSLMLEARLTHASPSSVVSQAYGYLATEARVGLDTVGLSYASHEAELFEELGITAGFARVTAIQEQLKELFMTVEQRRVREAQRVAKAFNTDLMERYAFQIQTPAPQWHNCDYPLPFGEFQLLVERPVTAGVYFASATHGTVDFYAPGTQAAARFTAEVPVEVVAFGASETGIRMARASTTSSRRQVATRVGLAFEDATFGELEGVLGGL